ncbi:MAG: NAD-dependent malic enzyme [Defluviitaleaceae bacterium]|nr:NAD-dependent malic enzyme [Defluviitaleaceae bacterium]
MEKALVKHYEWRGKYEIALRAPLDNKDDLSLAYTPGVALPCLEIEKDPSKSFELTRRWNTVAVITDGTAVLGLGDIGPLAAMPVMEGKAALFKKFGDVDAIPLCLGTKDPDEFVNAVALLEGSFGGINLEDISAPRCFEIEQKLKERLSIPVFHDDQHGTAIVALAAINNTLRLTKKSPDQVKVVVNGAGAAGTAIINLLIKAGFTNIIPCDRAGIIYKGKECLSPNHELLAKKTNHLVVTGGLQDAMVGADIFIGVSGPNCVTKEMVASMNDKSAVFAMANPTPEIMPDIAKSAGAYIVGTGRSDFPNQINNVLAFPGIFRGALDARAKKITDEMNLAAAKAIADYVKDEELSPDYIIPSALDKSVTDAVAAAVSAVCL